FDVEYIPSCDRLRIRFTNISQNSGTYHWDFGDGHTSALPDPTYEFDYNYNTRVILTATNGVCEDTASHAVDIKSFDYYNSPVVPNVFTPNGDGINDVFRVKVNGDLRECTDMVILTRWGQEIYSPPGGQLA
ncbi:MAG: gliding motility-associated C-terminal domain-containing protein, partial [Flavobacteriales bacterium]|nr:gliding motility-associated C-terminal domain-containing protein [Flavobacteriales bacterium]